MSAERSHQTIYLTDDSGNLIKVTQDGSDYKYEVLGKLRNSSGTIIDPATEGTLGSIKDTDGIRKIVDPLPVGTNVVGKFVIRNPGNTLDLGDSSNPIRTDPTGTTTQPVSASSLPLPAGAATESTLSSIDGKDFATQTTLSAANTKLGEIDTAVDSIDGKVATETTLAATNTRLGEVSATPTANTIQDRLKTIQNLDFATETTLQTIATQATVAAVQSVLEAMRDTSGIKKITDPLAAGTNRIGGVRLQDEADNYFDSNLNNGIYRQEARSSITSPNGATDADVGTTATGNNRLSVASALTDGVGWIATVVNNAIRRLETRGSITAPDGATDADVGTLATANNRLSVSSRLTDGVGWLSTIVNNTIRRIEGRNSITAPDGSLDVAVVTDNSINRLEARASIVGQTAGSGSEKKASVIDDVTDSNVKRLQVESLIAAGGAQQDVVLVDETNGVELSVADNVTIPVNTHGLLVAGVDDEGKSQFIAVEGDGKLKAASVPPTPPPNTTEVVYSQTEANLVVDTPTYNPHDTEFVIANGVSFYMQFVATGSEGDPSEKGSKIELYYIDSGSTYHIVDRYYTYGGSVTTSYPDVNKARDGTAMTGNGSSTKFVIRRERLSTSDGQVDCVVRGYTKTT